MPCATVCNTVFIGVLLHMRTTPPRPSPRTCVQELPTDLETITARMRTTWLRNEEVHRVLTSVGSPGLQPYDGPWPNLASPPQCTFAPCASRCPVALRVLRNVRCRPPRRPNCDLPRIALVNTAVCCSCCGGLSARRVADSCVRAHAELFVVWAREQVLPELVDAAAPAFVRCPLPLCRCSRARSWLLVHYGPPYS
jgi:hypothetical protein